MKYILAALLTLSCGSISFAQEAKVIKVKGQQAIVQFPKGHKPYAGETIDLSGGGGGDAGGAGTTGGGGSTGPREHSIGAAAEISSISSSNNVKGSSSTSTTTIALEGRYGWNAVTMEYGPLAALSRTSTDSGSSMTLKAGGFFDYNLVPNTAGAEMVYGLGAEAYVGQTSPSSGDSATLMGFAGGGFLKWFLLKTPTAFRGDLQYQYDRSSAGQVTTTTSGPIAKVGFEVYF